MDNDYRRFLKSYGWKCDAKGLDYIFDKSLYEFPVFSLNQDYVKALSNVVYGQLKSIEDAKGRVFFAMQRLQAP